MRIGQLYRSGFMLSGSYDGTVKVWDFKKGEIIYSSIITENRDSFSWTPEDYFTGDHKLVRKVVYIVDGSADINNNGYITLSELSVYIENDVPELTYEKWGYEQIPQKQLPKEDFPLVGK